MIKISGHEGVNRFLAGHPIAGKVQYWAACYLVGGVLVDSGCAHTANELSAALNQRPLAKVVNTHHHEDHVGGNAALARDHGAGLFASKAACELIPKPYELYPYQEMVWGRPEPSKPKVLGDAVTTDEIELLVIPAPGHSPDQVAFWDPHEKRLFAGDAFISQEPKTARADEDYSIAAKTLERLAALGPEVMFTGLGLVVENAAETLWATVGYLQAMKERISALAEKGLSADDIVKRLFGRESSLMQMTQGQMSYANFVRGFMRPSNAA